MFNILRRTERMSILHILQVIWRLCQCLWYFLDCFSSWWNSPAWTMKYIWMYALEILGISQYSVSLLVYSTSSSVWLFSTLCQRSILFAWELSSTATLLLISFIFSIIYGYSIFKILNSFDTGKHENKNEYMAFMVVQMVVHMVVFVIAVVDIWVVTRRFIMDFQNWSNLKWTHIIQV